MMMLSSRIFLVLCGIAIGVTFAALSPTAEVAKAPSALIRFVQECFRQHSRTLYLVGLEGMVSYRSYLALPYPKVIVQSGVSIGMPDESSLIVLFVDCRTRSFMYNTLSMILRDFNRIVRNGKYVVLVEDALLRHGNGTISADLGHFFATYNIVYWCVTRFRHATMLQYSLYLARHVHTIGSKLTYAPVFEWRRGLWRYERSTINGIAFTSFPYVYLRGEEYRGIDVTVMFTIIKKLGYVLELRVVEPTDNSDSDVVHIVDSLSRIKDDIMLTRRHVDAGILPVVYIAEATYFCLVAPRAAEINLTQSLLRPFSYEVWLFIVGCAVAISVLNELSQYDTRMGLWVRWICSCPPLPSFYSTCFAVISFVLIESYLATVTSFFLAYRFVPDAKTLEEFFATGIPIRLEEGMDTFLNNLEPRVRDLIVARGVRGTECEEFSGGCAHLDTFARASVRIKELVGVDPISGRKRSYIVPEMVARYSCMSHAFARGSPLTDVVAVYLRWMYEAGLMRLFHQDYEQYLQPNDYAHTFEDSLAFEHLMSLWVCVGIGWGVSCCVFILELVRKALNEHL